MTKKNKDQWANSPEPIEEPKIVMVLHQYDQTTVSNAGLVSVCLVLTIYNWWMFLSSCILFYLDNISNSVINGMEVAILIRQVMGILCVPDFFHLYIYIMVIAWAQ